MRTWKWTLTASLLIGFSAMAQQTTHRIVLAEPRLRTAQPHPAAFAERAAARQHARAAGSDACRSLRPPPWTRSSIAPSSASMP